MRQAINYAIDRDAINTAVYDGKGEPSGGFFASDSPLHNDEADRLLRPTTPEIRPRPCWPRRVRVGPHLRHVLFTPGASQRTVEIVQAQLAEIGVTMNVKPLTNSAEFFPDAKGAPMYIFELTRIGIQKVARVLVPGSVGNICNWDNAELNSLVAQIKAVAPDSTEAVALWKDLQELALADAMNLFILFGVQATAYNRTGWATWSTSAYTGLPEINIFKVYVKS